MSQIIWGKNNRLKEMISQRLKTNAQPGFGVLGGTVWSVWKVEGFISLFF